MKFVKNAENQLTYIWNAIKRSDNVNKEEINELSLAIVYNGDGIATAIPTKDSVLRIRTGRMEEAIEEYFNSKLPTVSSKVAVYLSKDINRTLHEKVQFLMESRNGDQYYFCEMMPEDGDLTQEQGEWLHEWAQEQSLEFLFSLVNGYKIKGVE